MNRTFECEPRLFFNVSELPQDRRHILKLFGTYAFDSGFQVGGNFFFRSGRPVNSFGIHPSDPFAAQYGPLSFFTGGEPRPRGCCGTTDSIWNLDTMFKYDFAVGGMNMNLRLDIFNIFDQSGSTEVNEHGDTFQGSPNPRYGSTTHYQMPRVVRLGAGLNF